MPSFNIFRFRDVNAEEFYDPATDMLRIFPKAVMQTLQTLDDLLHDRPEYSDGLEMAHRVLTALEVRLIEEPVPVNEALWTFMRAFNEIPGHVRLMFAQTLMMHLMAFYAVAARRVETSSKPRWTDDDAMAVGTLLSLLDRQQSAELTRQLKLALLEPMKMLSTPESKASINFYDEHDNEVLHNAKQYVGQHFKIKNGEQTWDEIAAIVDRVCSQDQDKESAAMRGTYVKY